MSSGRRRAGRRPAATVAALALVLGGCAAGAGPATGAPPEPTTVAAEVADPEAVVPLDPPGTPELPVTVEDAQGHAVTVEAVDRILPLTGALSEAVVSLGLGDRLVGRDVSATFAQVAELPVVTQGHDVSAEQVLALRPDVVLADTATGPPEALRQIRAAGVAVVVLEEVWELAEVAPRLRAVAGTLGVAEAGERLVARTTATIEAATATVDDDGSPPRVAFLYLRGNAGVYLLGGPGSGADDLVAAAGGIDAGVTGGLSRPFTPISTEALAAARPDVLLVMDAGLDSVGGVDGLLELPGIAQTPAAAQRRVVSVEDGRLLSFGPRTGAVVAELARDLHGDAS